MDETIIPTPILRWVGGKQYVRGQLLACCPADAPSRRYFEPFLGAASLFLMLQPRRAILGDANPHLISAYDYVRRNGAAVARVLERLAASDCAKQYYTVREVYNRSRPSPAQAARFIYLNRACFNGIFRVNKQGKFNVPYGYRRTVRIPKREELLAFGAALRQTKLLAADFEVTLESARAGDFVYLDPPYPPLNGTSYFAHYTMDRFGEDEQRRLAAVVRELERRGSLFLMSNADTPLIRTLYRGFAIRTLSVTRYVTCKATKHRVRELIISNYDLR